MEQKHLHKESCGHDHDHDHAHKESCGCGHDHDHAHKESCGHDHDHAHEERCGCGHDHAYEGSCYCGHDHDHAHEESCDCGHDHDHAHEESCGCGHDHAHQESCDCGHDHDHAHGESCECGHDHPHKESCGHDQQEASVISAKAEYTLHNLGCANCAAKMEAKIKALPGVSQASISFVNKTLYLDAEDPDGYLQQIQKICGGIESAVVVEKRIRRNKPTAHQQDQDQHHQNRELIELILGALLLIGAVVLDKTVGGVVPLLVFVASYLVLGYQVIGAAGKNLFGGHVFDENFLMSIATLGAFAIQEYPEAVGVMLFFKVGEYFEHRAVQKSRSAIMDAIDMRPEVVQKISGDTVVTIPAQEARVGDLVLVRPGDRIPLDGVIVSGTSFLDTAAITGESVPIEVIEGENVLSGCVNQSGLLTLKVEKALEDSMVSRILDAVENAAASKPKMDRFITRFARVYTPIVVAIAALTAVVPPLAFGADWYYWIHTALTFLVISCPCALVLSVPLAYFSGIGAGGKEGILFKGGAAIEVLKQVDLIAMDKTGTITKGNFVVADILPALGYDHKAVLTLAATCEQGSTHPIAKSILNAAQEQQIQPQNPVSMEEISGHGIVVVLENGDKISCGNEKLMQRQGVAYNLPQDDQFGSLVLLAVNNTFAGIINVSDTIKPEAKSAVERMHKLGLKTAMLTGDRQENAQAVAKICGIDTVKAQLLPEQKLAAIEQLREEYGRVMFVGDGINDAPVLAGADVGAAMGSGADAAIEAADVVFMNASVDAIVRSIEIAKKSYNAAMQNVVFALVVKAMVMVLGFAGIANMWFAVFADSGVAMLCVLNSIRVLYNKK